MGESGRDGSLRRAVGTLFDLLRPGLARSLEFASRRIVGRLALLLGGLAAGSTAFALLHQARSLDRDLRDAAVERLEGSAEAIDRLVAAHLLGLAERYQAISRTPELRANLATRHAATLAFHAEELRARQGAVALAFLDTEGRELAAAGDATALARAEDALSTPAGAEATWCVATAPAREAAPGGTGRALYAPCGVARSARATLVGPDDELRFLVEVPLRTGDRVAGRLIAIEPASPALLEEWSDLAGAIVFAGTAPPEAELVRPVRSFGELAIGASTTYDVEAATIRRARSNLLWSGALVLALSLAAALWLARWFASPIVRLREATERLARGRLDARVHVDRGDEIGDLGRAFNQLADRLADSQRRLARAQRLARFGNWYLDLDTLSVNGTEEFHRLLEREGEEPFAWSEMLEHIHPEDRAQLERAVRRSRERAAPFRLDVRTHAPPGRGRILHIRGQPRPHGDARIEGSVQDVTERRRAEEQIRFLSMHDPLTGLGNREYLLERLSLRTRGPRREKPFALALIGLVDLDSIVTSMGHAVADELVAEFASRLVASVRGPLRPGSEAPDAAARIGDDRFAIIFEEIEDAEAATSAARRLLERLGGPFVADEHEVTLNPTFGLAFWPRDARSPEKLLRNCEAALTRGLRDGSGGFRLFHESMHEETARRLRIASGLRRAVEEDGFELHFQPRVDPESRAPVGFEALARWTHPELGPIAPAEFIPIAEENGTIRDLGDWCLGRAAEQLRAWSEAGRSDLFVSVNLSAHDLDRELARRALAHVADLDPSRIELEVTESALIEDRESALVALTALREAGFRIALDDFGTGYSSLSYLQILPIDTVKLDRSFIRRIVEEPEAAALAEAVISMCHALSLHTVVEGVETEEQLTVLRALGCDEAQGYLFSRPMTASDAEAYLSAFPAGAEKDGAGERGRSGKSAGGKGRAGRKASRPETAAP